MILMEAPPPLEVYLGGEPVACAGECPAVPRAETISGSALGTFLSIAEASGLPMSLIDATPHYRRLGWEEIEYLRPIVDARMARFAQWAAKKWSKRANPEGDERRKSTHGWNSAENHWIGVILEYTAAALLGEQWGADRVVAPMLSGRPNSIGADIKVHGVGVDVKGHLGNPGLSQWKVPVTQVERIAEHSEIVVLGYVSGNLWRLAVASHFDQPEAGLVGWLYASDLVELAGTVKTKHIKVTRSELRPMAEVPGVITEARSAETQQAGHDGAGDHRRAAAARRAGSPDPRREPARRTRPDGLVAWALARSRGEVPGRRAPPGSG